MESNEIMQDLTGLVKGLSFMSESERPFQVFDIGNMREKEMLFREIAKIVDQPPGAFKQVEPASFFNHVINSADPADEQMVVYADRIRKLYEYLKTRFRDIQIIRAGEVQVHISIVGITEDNACYLLHTVSIET